MTNLQKQILLAVKAGKAKTNTPRHVHVKYLPEVLALVNSGELILVESSISSLIVDIP